MRVPGRVGGRPFLSLESHAGEQAASRWVYRRHPHAELADAVRQRRRETIRAVDQSKRRDLPIRQTRRRRRIRRIGIDVVRAAPGRPWATVTFAIGRGEDRPARHVVVDHAVDQAVQVVALAQELGANRRGLCRGHPVRQRLLVNANQLGRQHERREVHDWDHRHDAVVVGRIALHHGQSLASTLRGPDEVAEARPLAIHTLDDEERRVVRLLELHVREVLDGFVVGRPVVVRAGGACASGVSAGGPATAAERGLMARVAAVANVAGSEIGVRQLGNDAVHATTAALDGAVVPGRGQDHPEVDRPGAGRLVDRRHRTVDHALRGGRALASGGSRSPGRGVHCHGADRLTDCRRWNGADLLRRAVGLGDHLVRAERRQFGSGRLNRRRGRRLRPGPRGQQASRGENESQGGHTRTAASHVGLSQGMSGFGSETLPSGATSVIGPE